MTFEQDLGELSRQVSYLLAHGGQVHRPEDLPLALTAHAATVHLLRHLHRDITGLPVRFPPQVTLEELERDPLRLLGRLLHRHLTLPGVSLIDALSRDLDGAARQWAAVARYATLAQHGWDAADPRSRPRRDTAWGLIGDVAALAQGAAVLDLDLAASLKAAGRPLDAAALERASHSGLRSAAATVRHIAERHRRHPLQLQPRDDGRIVRVRSVPDLPAAAQRVTTLIRGAKVVTPQDAAGMATGLARILVVVSGALNDATRGLEGSPSIDVAAALDRQARALLGLAREARRFVSIHETDRRPLAQLIEIRQHMTTYGERWPTTRATTDLTALTALGREATRAAGALASRWPSDLAHWLQPAYGIDGRAEHWITQALADVPGQGEMLSEVIEANRTVSKALGGPIADRPTFQPRRLRVPQRELVATPQRTRRP